VSAPRAASGSLTVVGTGIDAGGQLTPQARASFAAADEAFYLVADPVAVRLLEWLNPRARSLHAHYADGKDRFETYEGIADEILAPLRRGRDVCAAFYGHPGVYVYPARVAVERARAEGFTARMFPGVSSLDCLFADLGLDPAFTGCQVYHATEFLIRRIEPDPATLLVLFQIGAIGQSVHHDRPDWSNLPVLLEYLTGFYPSGHEVIAYAASPYPLTRPIVERAPLERLAQAELTIAMTLVVPPATTRDVDPTMLERLGQPGR
jgi:precorrin-6B methylase 1